MLLKDIVEEYVMLLYRMAMMVQKWVILCSEEKEVICLKVAMVKEATG